MKIRNWFDTLEKVLEIEAKQAGLLEHNVMIGSAREFLVKRVLKSVLPSIIHTGSGRIIDSKNNCSKQIDIIIYDSRFPIFEIESGIGLYLIEGVISCIEIKSTLTKTELNKALDNSKSILDLQFGVTSNSSEQLKEILTKRKKATFELMPSTYIFSYTSKISHSKLCDYVDLWFQENGRPSSKNNLCAYLPRVIIAGKIVGLLDDGFLQIEPPKRELQEWKEKYKCDPKTIMGFWKINYRFGFLLINVLHDINSRFSMIHNKQGIEYGLDQYITSIDYFETEMKNKFAHYLVY